METVYLITGSNLGNKKENLDFAAKRLAESAGNAICRSGFYESGSWGYKSTYTFYNQALALSTRMDPFQLLQVIHDIERQKGPRKREGGYHDRHLDIDILFYDKRIIHDRNLIIPHPRLEYRRFVLAPLCEIAPYFVHPESGKTMIDLYEACPDEMEVRRL